MKIEIENATLYLGDALEILTSLHEAADCLVTDPPYMLTSGGCGDHKSKMRGIFAAGSYDNGGALFESVPEWYEFMPYLFACLKSPAHAYIMADSKNQFEMQRTARDAGFRFHNLLYWDKGTCTPNRWYMKNAEYIGFFFKGKAYAINDCGARQGLYVPHIDETTHPTEKPSQLLRVLIENSTQAGQVVIDPFMGSGSTGVAALRSGRKFIGIEKDPKWFEVARRRIENAISGQTIEMF